MILHKKINWKREDFFIAFNRDVIKYLRVSDEYLKLSTENKENMKKILFCLPDLTFR